VTQVQLGQPAGRGDVRTVDEKKHPFREVRLYDFCSQARIFFGDGTGYRRYGRGWRALAQWPASARIRLRGSIQYPHQRSTFPAPWLTRYRINSKSTTLVSPKSFIAERVSQSQGSGKTRFCTGIELVDGKGYARQPQRTSRRPRVDV
jgi:hypothetical protein